jgi:radical SAM superfamily enzyme YgiQ (UPF0313 family)
MIDEDLLRGMKKGGCWMIGYGIEAGTQRVLDLMKKNIKLENIEKAVKVTRKIGIEVTGHVIVGFPGETEEDILATSRLVKKLDLDYIQVYCSVPFPGSPIYSEAKEAGYINTPDWAMFEQNFSVLDTPWLRASRVMELREKIVRDFYLNPRKILKTAAKVRNPREAGFLFRFAADYFRSWVGKR